MEVQHKKDKVLLLSQTILFVEKEAPQPAGVVAWVIIVVVVAAPTEARDHE